jgi:hypothetical protein
MNLQSEQFKAEVNQRRAFRKLSTLKDNYKLDSICSKRIETFIQNGIQKNDQDYWDTYGLRVAEQMEIGKDFNKGRELFFIMKYSQDTPLTTPNKTIFQQLYLSNSSAFRGILKNHYTDQSCKSYYDLKTQTLYVLHLFLGVK